MAERLSLKLFLAGMPSKSVPSEAGIREMLDRILSIPYDLSIVDVFENPQLAEVADILVTPTLVVRSRGIERRLVGDLTDLSRLQLVIADSEKD